MSKKMTATEMRTATEGLSKIAMMKAIEAAGGTTRYVMEKNNWKLQDIRRTYTNMGLHLTNTENKEENTMNTENTNVTVSATMNTENKEENTMNTENTNVTVSATMNTENKEEKNMTTATENTNVTVNAQGQNKEEEKKAMEAKKQAEKEAKAQAKKAEQEKKAAEKAKKAEERKAAKEKAEAEKKAKAEAKAHAKENAQGVIDKALENVDHKYTPGMGRTTVLNGKVGMFYMEVGQKAVVFHSKEDMVPEGVTAKVMAGNPVNPYAVTVAHEELEKVLGQYLSKMEQVKAVRNEAKAKAQAEKEAAKKAEKEAKAAAKAEEKARKAAEKEAAKKAKAEAKKAEEPKAE